MSYQPPQRSTSSSMAIVSLVFGILAWVMLPFVGALIAVICGHLARGEIRRAPTDQRIEGDGMAIAGLVLGYVQLTLSVLMVIFVIAMLVFGFGFGFGFGFAHWH